MRTQKGFSLIELLIVTAIIGVVTAIAVPSLLRSRRAAEESSAVGSLRAYSSAQYAYHAARGQHQFFGLPAELADGFIEPAFVTSPVRNGYAFTFVVPDDRRSFTANADPLYTDSQSRHFYTDNTGVIKYEIGAPATTASLVLGAGTD